MKAFRYVIILLMSITLNASETTINLTRLEVFDPFSLTVYKLKSHYLLSSTMPSDKLQIVNHQGDLLFEYAVEGQGPGALNGQSILTFSEDEIYVQSKGVGVLVFDHHLKLLPETNKIKPLQLEFAMVSPFGLPISEEAFLVFGHRFLDYHLYRFSITDAFGTGPWKPQESLLKKYSEKSGMKDPEISFIHQDVVFTYRLYIMDQLSEYQVFAHQEYQGQWKIVAELVGSVEEIPPFIANLKGVINNVFKIEGGFLVEVAGAHPTSTNQHEFTNYYDFFNDQGVFQRRITKLNHMIFPVNGSAELLERVIDGEDDVLRTLDVSTLKP